LVENPGTPSGSGRRKKGKKPLDSRLKISGMTEKNYKGALPPYEPL